MSPRFQHRIRIDLAYVGEDFYGWQMQPDRRSVQGDLAAMLERLVDRRCIPVGAGRTDAGVHARGQVAHVELANAAEVARVCGALSKLQPADIHITAVRPVSVAFNARHSATARRYAYRLKFERNIFDCCAFQVPRWLDQDAMNAACRFFKGDHDFSSFCKTGSLKENNHCAVDLCALEWSAEGGIFHIRANRFLHHMVRNLVGLLVEIGRDQRATHEVEAILAAQDRQAAGKMSPAHGLFLEEVYYPDELMDPDYLPPDYHDRPHKTADEGDIA